MTAEKHASKIWNNLFQKQIEITGNGDGNLCVELALIVVDEILNDNTSSSKMINGKLISGKEYWQEVRKEILKL
jgi:hypothetical protein